MALVILHVLTQTTYVGTKKELSKRRRGHEMLLMQWKGRHSRTCTRVSNSRNSIQNKK